MHVCNLTPTPHDLQCDFAGSPGSVALRVDGSIGAIEFARVRYNGFELPGVPSDEIAFTIVPGRTTLDVVYAFSDPENGVGVLAEICEGKTVLIAVTAKHPAVRYRIVA
jgi:hypothetical protein